MTDYLLVHGAGQGSWAWGKVWGLMTAPEEHPPRLHSLGVLTASSPSTCRDTALMPRATLRPSASRSVLTQSSGPWNASSSATWCWWGMESPRASYCRRQVAWPRLPSASVSWRRCTRGLPSAVERMLRKHQPRLQAAIPAQFALKERAQVPIPVH